MKKRPSKNKAATPPATATTTAKAPAPAVRKPARGVDAAEVSIPLSAGRKLFYRFIALVVLPLLLLCLIELGLRLAGAGHATGFFKSSRIAGRDFLSGNEDFSLRFFPPQLARWPGPLLFEKHKPPGTIRIFILGESAARGEPEPPYSAARYLETMLAERHPGTRFEILNTSITAINSHVILPIARDCANADGDLWIVYMGNNEMVGPYGAATVFGAKAPPLGMVRASLALQKTRIAQTLMAIVRKLKGRGANASWGGMKMFIGNQLQPDDPRREVVFQNFNRNLQDILQVGVDSGAKILLNRVAVNLADCPPFASLGATNLSPSQVLDFQKLLTNGAALIDVKNFSDAQSAYEQAVKLNPQYAEAHYQLARCLAARTNLSRAREEFQAACDLDALPFRTGTRINGIISDNAAKFAGKNLDLMDAPAWLDKASPIGISGAESFFEHVHFTFEGNYLLARAWAVEVEKMFSAEIPQAANKSWLSQAECENRLGLSDWNRGAVAESVLFRLHRPPLEGQSNNRERLAATRAAVDAISQRTDAPGAPAKARAMFLAAIKNAPEDHWVHENFAEFLEMTGDIPGSTEEWRKVCALLPDHFSGWHQLGRALSHSGKFQEAMPCFQRTLALRPNMVENWFEMGQAQLALGRAEDALESFRRAHDLEPGEAGYMAWTGKALSQLKRHEEAADQFKKAIELQPELWEAHMAYGDELASDKKFEAASEQYSLVAAKQPSNALAHLDYGVMLARLGRIDSAIAEFQTTLRLQPGNQQAREYLDRVADYKNARH